MSAIDDMPAGSRAYIGKALPRREDERLLRGEGCYVDDVKYLDMAHVAIVRGAVAHGVIRAIDATEAMSMAGVLAVYTAADLGREPPCIPVRVGPMAGLERCQQPVIARDRVRYVGEPVAVVVAVDRYTAEDAADSVRVDIDALPVVVDVASAGTGTLLHDSVPANQPVHYQVARGNVDDAFTSAPYTRTERFYVHRHSAVPLETRGVVAHWRDDGHLDVWGAAKVPFFNRKLLASLLEIEETRIDMHELDTGGSFGARGEFYPEDFLVPFVAMKLKRAVKWIEDRRENLLCMNHSRDMHCEIGIAATAGGRILGLRASIVNDIGAYSRTTGGIVAAKCAMFLPGPYDIADYHAEVSIILTNKTPAGTYRGPGRYEANFFRERMIDLMCQDLGLDPAATRERNLIRPEQMPYGLGRLVPYENEQEYDTGDYPAALRRALDAIGYDDIARSQGQLIDGRYHGVGIGCFVDSSGAGPSEMARIRIVTPRKIELYTGCSSSGQGHETSFAQVLAEILSVPIETIAVFHGSTTTVPRGFGTYHGRGMVMGGNSVKAAADQLIQQWIRWTADRHGLSAEELRFENGHVLDRGGASLMDIERLCAEGAPVLLSSTATYEQRKVTFEYGTQVAHVAVDPRTSEIEVVELVSVEDCGRVINPLIVHGQVLGASVQGLGGTLLEEFRYDEAGQMLSGTFADYMLPTATDFADVKAISIDMAPSTLNPLGAKGVGEGGIEGVGAAVANAICHALGAYTVNIKELPITPNSLFEAISAHRDREAARSSFQ